jgi:hypothetical protein
MIIRGLTEAQIHQAVDKVENAQVEYTNRKTKNAVNVKLTVKSSRGKYGKTSVGYGRVGQRRVHALCWHGFRDVFFEIFKLNPNAVIITAQARYDGLEDFREKYPRTGNKNIGSMIEPVRYNTETAKKCLIGEVATYDQYLTGDVWFYSIQDSKGEVLDSCYGFYGYEYARKEAEEIFAHFVDTAKTERLAQEDAGKMEDLTP